MTRSEPLSGATRAERGSAVAEYAMVAGLVVVVVFALLQVAFALWVRTILTDAAAEGARLAAVSGGSQESAARRASELVASALGPGYSPAVAVRRDEAALGVPGYDVVVVELSAPLPVLGLLGPERSLSVTGSAVVEQ